MARLLLLPLLLAAFVGAPDRRSWRSGAILLTVILPLLSIPSVCLAQDYIVDQRNDHFVPTGYLGVIAGSPMGQQIFTTEEWVDFIEFWIDSGGGGSVTFQVALHEGDIGAIELRRTGPVTLAEWFHGPVRFSFDDSLYLETGVWVFELIVLDGAGSVGDGRDTYSEGRMIYRGRPSHGSDLWFRQGKEAETPVQKESWGRVKSRFAKPSRAHEASSPEEGP